MTSCCCSKYPVHKVINVHDRSDADRGNEKKLICEYCEYKCKKLVKIKKHMSTKHCTGNVKCKECEKRL